MSDRTSFRLPAALIFGGQILFIVAGIFHPGSVPANDHPAVFAEYATSAYWGAVHMGQFAGLGVMLAGFIALAFALGIETGAAAWIGRFAAVGAVITVALMGVLQAVDGVALKAASDAWFAAPAAEQPARLATLEGVRWLEWGVRSYQRSMQGLTLILLATQIVLTGGFPDRLDTSGPRWPTYIVQGSSGRRRVLIERHGSGPACVRTRHRLDGRASRCRLAEATTWSTGGFTDDRTCGSREDGAMNQVQQVLTTRGAESDTIFGQPKHAVVAGTKRSVPADRPWPRWRVGRNRGRRPVRSRLRVGGRSRGRASVSTAWPDGRRRRLSPSHQLHRHRQSHRGHRCRMGRFVRGVEQLGAVPSGQTTRVCTYDRAGMGYSEPGPLPRTADRFAAELRALLTNAGELGPYVLVGHSMGGLTVRVFAHEYPVDVAGVVLIDR